MPTSATITALQRRIALLNDETAYKELFCTFYKPLLQFAQSFTGAAEVAEELVSDVFITIWERRQQLTRIENLKVYLYVCTKNNALKYLQQQKKQPFTTLDEMKVEPESLYYDPEQLLVTAELLKRLQQAIQQLPPRCKLVYKLVKEDGLKYKEVAEILGISVKTIDNQLAIALRKIGNAVNVNLKKIINF